MRKKPLSHRLYNLQDSPERLHLQDRGKKGIPQDRYYIRSDDILYPSGVMRIASHTTCGALSGFILFLIRPKKHPPFGKPPLPV